VVEVIFFRLFGAFVGGVLGLAFGLIIMFVALAQARFSGASTLSCNFLVTATAILALALTTVCAVGGWRIPALFKKGGERERI